MFQGVTPWLTALTKPSMKVEFGLGLSRSRTGREKQPGAAPDLDELQSDPKLSVDRCMPECGSPGQADCSSDPIADAVRPEDRFAQSPLIAASPLSSRILCPWRAEAMAKNLVILLEAWHVEPDFRRPQQTLLRTLWQL